MRSASASVSILSMSEPAAHVCAPVRVRGDAGWATSRATAAGGIPSFSVPRHCSGERLWITEERGYVGTRARLAAEDAKGRGPWGGQQTNRSSTSHA